MTDETIQYALAAVCFIVAIVLILYIKAKPWLDVVKRKKLIIFTDFETVPKAVRLDQLLDTEVIEQLNGEDNGLVKALEEEAISRKLIYKVRLKGAY